MTGPHWQPLSVRLENAIVAYARYLGKAVLAFEPGCSLSAPRQFADGIGRLSASLLLLVAITAIDDRVPPTPSLLLVGWLWFLGTLVPMIGIVQVGVQAMADRYAYLPFIGLFIMICWLLADLADRRRITPAWQCGNQSRDSAGAGNRRAPATGSLAGQQSDLVAGRRAGNAGGAGESQELGGGRCAGSCLPQTWRCGRGGTAFPRGHDHQPFRPGRNVNFGTYEQRERNLPAAIEQYKKVIAMTQNTARQDAQSRAQAFSNMGFAYIDLREYPQAKASFEQGVQLNPDDARSWLGIALASHRSGDLNAAIDAYTRSLNIAAVDWEYLLLARALADNGRHDEAAVATRRAAGISQNFGQAQKIAASMLAK